MNQLSIHNPATAALITRVAADDATSVSAKAASARVAQAGWQYRWQNARNASFVFALRWWRNLKLWLLS